ncbi:hypothetical protein OKW50_001631 [Paraburkholderia youngii]|uniref:Uncharacterized protein n=1 Tax=Paraburkholderia youngii TaxID=2782701 RepID=A0A7W8L2K4_9BURK|nr:hypothetical protein [Paraburkholderia youngii]MBB5399307.1 hypothetical protein [Paraburkholderia youngii]NUX52222.1 hypothetical protein [Paraburkholderia youngii]NVI03024.1 hypothetical protein [Paraburkholderia youngii]
MLLSDEELARLEGVEPFLREEARSALPADADYEVLAELHEHLQPGIRIRVPAGPDIAMEPRVPPYPLDLFVGLPLDELRDVANDEGAAREAALARFATTFAPRLQRAIAALTPYRIDLAAGVQSERGTLTVMLEPVR